MYQVDMCMFRDRGEDREWDAFRKMNEFPTMGEAVAYARAVVGGLREALERIADSLGCDGVSIDVRRCADPKPHAYEYSYELVPGRPVGYWRADECHEASHVG